jgi:hypothetical protein
MSAATEWPNVTALIESKLSMPVLDNRAPPYPAEWLRERAEQYAADPEMVRLLQLLADYPALNNKLNRQSVTVRNQNIALHYQIACALEHQKQRKDVRERVGDIWCISPEHVKDINTEHGPTAVTWLANLITHIDVRSEFASRADILTALDKDMCLRARAIRAN